VVPKRWGRYCLIRTAEAVALHNGARDPPHFPAKIKVIVFGTSMVLPEDSNYRDLQNEREQHHPPDRFWNGTKAESFHRETVYQVRTRGQLSHACRDKYRARADQNLKTNFAATTTATSAISMPHPSTRALCVFFCSYIEPPITSILSAAKREGKEKPCNNARGRSFKAIRELTAAAGSQASPDPRDAPPHAEYRGRA